MKKIILSFTLLLLSGFLIPGDMNVRVNYGGYYSNNIFLNASTVADYISQLETNLNFSLKRINIYLDASMGLLIDNPEFNSFYLENGIEYQKYLKGRNSLYAKLGFSMLNYKELYRDFNYLGPQFQSGLKFYTSQQTLIKIGYYFQSRQYTHFDSFDFYNHTVFAEFNRFFDSQTTVRLQGGFNYRYYPHIENEIESDQGPKNKNGQPVSEFHTMSVPNLYTLLRLAQGFGTRIGINAEAEFRHNFRGLEDAQTLIQNSYIVYPYNDNYLWDGWRLSLMVRLILFKEISLTAKFSYYDKFYPGIYLLDTDGNVVEPLVERHDNLITTGIYLEKKLKRFDLFTQLVYRNNQSNDDFFTYPLFTISMGISYYF